MHRLLLLVVVGLSASGALLPSCAVDVPSRQRLSSAGFDHSLRGWLFRSWRAEKRPHVFLHPAPPSSAAALPLTVSTDLSEARRFFIDIDLDHDGRFVGAGELAYTEGRFEQAETGSVRLHGLVPGTYRVRARAVLADGSQVASAVESVEVLAAPSQLPIAFEPNRGQTDEAVLFLARAKGQTVYVTSDETVLVGANGRATRIRLVGANSWARPVGTKKLPGSANYFIGSDPDKWRTNIETYEELLTRDVYPGIDLVYYSRAGRLAYDFRIAAGADPSVIALEFPDVSCLSIDENGELLLHLPGGDVLRNSAPLMYQEGRGPREAVKGDWVPRGSRQAGYAIATYDRGRELVIDPYLFSTYLGGSGVDGSGFSSGPFIKTDAAGNCYIGGTTTSINFPVSGGAFQPTSGGTTAAFAAKLNPSGTALLYSTYVGGGGTGTFGKGITVDAAGNVYLVGLTDSFLPTTPGAYQTVFGGAGPGPDFGDAFVTKINPTGTALIYSTFLGGRVGDGANCVAVDPAGNAYVGGWSGSIGNPNPFPTTAGSFQPTATGSVQSPFVAKLNAAGTALVYSSFLGGVAPTGISQNAFGIALDSTGNAYVTGRTNAPDFPVTPGAFQVTPPAAVGAGNWTGFVSKINAAGSALLYSTYLGGNTRERGQGIVADAAGNAYVTGWTASSSFPVTPGAFQTTYQGGVSDAFVTKLNPSGSALVYSTYLGGTAADEAGNAIAIDASGSAFVAGWTGNNTFPTAGPATQPVHAGANDAFVTQINSTGTALVFSTFLGGTGADAAYSIAMDSSGAIYAAGATSSPNFPTLAPIQAANAGGLDIFITKLTTGIPPPPPPPPPLGPAPGPPGEGTYVGCKGPAGNEGGFGFGGAIRPERQPLLRGPTPIATDDAMVRNVAHLQTGEDGSGWMVLLSAALAGLIVGALGIRVVRTPTRPS